ncbi:type VII secretion protein EccB [Streptomyces sp. AK02-01A]|uniref:type VII secretion protein EccB n=1 Tax=Streptomyces sp. AK02-01A TaxID=3028648 RepID=UPI0029B8773F|nr:type VII secretion protein EccB [Streptomyces sp. AK02-01A]MDX3855717.1 type VII secretion protein EccB [Streptomyces sp. AK02-01A]
MASRRDELNAYTFAKKRTVAAFLQPSPTGTEEGAPRPLRAVVPGLIVGALVLAGFGAWGMFKPNAPKDWAAPGTKVIVGKESTTRYVVLTTGKGKDKETLLHPVLNLASARLLLTPQQFAVIQVSDSILDSGKPPRGPILGIPYAPDRLPTDQEAAKAKRWAVCEQPGGGKGSSVQKAAFVLADRDFSRTEGKQRLTGGQVLYVKGQNGTRHLVDAGGTKYELSGAPGDNLTRALIGLNREPQAVTDDWLATLHTGSPVDFPEIPGEVGDRANAGGGLTEGQDRVGMVLLAQTGSGPQHYVVLPGKVQPVSDFTAWLLINSPQTDKLNMAGRAATVDAASFAPESGFFGAEFHWPARKAAQVNTAGGAAARDTVCSVLRTVDDKGATTLSTWAGPAYPAEITAGGTSTYVTPGSGLLYTQVRGEQTRPDGSLFLVTDTGLRYAVQSNGDSDAARSDIGTGDQQKQQDGRPEPSQAQIRLGYEKVTPALVPIAWSEFLSKGPRLDTNSARQPQGS